MKYILLIKVILFFFCTSAISQNAKLSKEDAIKWLNAKIKEGGTMKDSEGVMTVTEMSNFYECSYIIRKYYRLKINGKDSLISHSKTTVKIPNLKEALLIYMPMNGKIFFTITADTSNESIETITMDINNKIQSKRIENAVEVGPFLDEPGMKEKVRKVILQLAIDCKN